MQSESSCVFCQEEALGTYLLAETEHFMTVCDRSPVAEGHVLLIPKLHYRCYASIPTDLSKEILGIKEEVSSFLSTYYTALIFFEHGSAGQTVPHAHLHMMPTPKRGIEGDIVTSLLSNMGQIVEVSGIVDLLDSYEKIGPYLYWEQDGVSYVVKSPEVESGYFQNVVARWTGRTGEAERRYTGVKEFRSIKEKWDHRTVKRPERRVS